MVAIVNAQVLRNFLALCVLQGGNYLLPLILVPYLLRALGLSAFGDWAFAVSFVVIFRTVVNYGFDLTATRSVALRRDDVSYLSELYVAVVLIRLSLFVLCCLALLLIAFGFENIWNVLLLSMLSMLTLAGEALFPVWLFQGMETMSVITTVRLTFKAAFVGLVILFVNSHNEILLIPLFEAATSLIAGLTALGVARSKYGLVVCMPSLEFIRDQLRSGAAVFLSFITVHFYSTINVVVLGAYLGPIAVAQYTIAEKIYSAIRGMLGPVVQALYPALSRTHGDSIEAFNGAARRIALVFVCGLLVFAIMLYGVSDWIVHLVAGQPEPVAVSVLQILAVALCFAIGTLFSPMLVIQKKSAVMLRITVAMTVVNLAILPLLVYLFGVKGAAWAFLATQAFQAILQLVASANIFVHEAHLLRRIAGYFVR